MSSDTVARMSAMYPLGCSNCNRQLAAKAQAAPPQSSSALMDVPRFLGSRRVLAILAALPRQTARKFLQVRSDCQSTWSK